MDYCVRVTVLVDNNTSRANLKAEHGLSLWIEYGEKRILFDTGQSNALVTNAEKLGIDLAQTNAIVLSHGHYDHTGGLYAVLDFATKAKIYLHPAAIETKFSHKTTVAKSIGMSASARKAIQSRNIIWTAAPAWLFPSVAVTGQVPRINDFEDVGGSFFLDEIRRKADELLDDQTLFIESAKGLIVVLGCAHAGVVNILNHVAKITNQRNAYAIIGGMHLVNSTLARIENTIEAFKEYDVQKIIPLHCTGRKAMEALKTAFGDNCLCLGAGEQFTF
jgi:7,8-dihydropterin-6-yl-methyl-4-(beta-D-ribofuranosyl)aminobenzene 5'-phosphate synthase